ncbi:MAG: PatB family C-S lyase [Anaerolineaceae bacterium]|nr:PatB family C-S lyase [Anaerolineaceae bacterium]
MSWNFDEIIDRRASDSIKWNYFDEDVLPMWVADMDFRAPDVVIDALLKRVQHGVFGYASQETDTAAAVVDYLKQQYAWQVDPEAIVFLPGVVVGFNLASHALVGEGEGVLIQPPVYMPFLTTAKNVSGMRQDAQLVCDEYGRYSIDWDVLNATFEKNTRMFLLCSPHNPVGRVWTRPELERVAEECLRRGVAICSDEIHADLVFSESKHIPIGALDHEIGKQTITLMAPSKTFNVPGLYCSFAVIPNKDLRKKFLAARRGVVGESNVLGMTAAAAAYREGRPWLDALLTYLQNNRDSTEAFIRQNMPDLKMTHPEGTYLAWIDCHGAGLGDNPAEFFKNEARVALNEGSWFGAGGEGFVRLNFGCPRSMLMEGLERMRAALAGR